MEQTNTEYRMSVLKNIVENTFGVDIMKKRRGRDYVNARLIYSKILRDAGHTFESIGESLNKDHSTIIHYIDISNAVFMQDDQLSEKYFVCKELFMKDNPNLSREYKEFEMTSKIFRLTSERDELLKQIKFANEIKNKYKRLESIIELINMRTPIGLEKSIEIKINRMFNELTKEE